MCKLTTSLKDYQDVEFWYMAEVERRAGVAVAEVEGEPFGSSSADAGEGRSCHSPKADGEPLEQNSVDEGEAEVAVAEGRRRAPRADLCRRGRGRSRGCC